MDEKYLIYVFFAYGLTLFAMGLSITLETRGDSPLALAGSLRWLAGFGFVHGAVEWLVMFDLMRRSGVALPYGDLLSALILPSLVISGFLQAQFGASLLTANTHKSQWVRWVPLLLLVLWLFTLWLASGGLWFTADWTRLGIVTARYTLYVPGAILSGLALMSQRPMLKAIGLPNIARDCSWGAAAFGFKGLIAGVSVPAAAFFPASVLNSSTFLAAVGLPPEVFRALAAIGITYFILRVLHLFEVQRRREMEHVSGQLKRLSHQVLSAQEEERKRIARELHDDTAQLLSSLLLRLKMLERAKSLEEVRDKSKHLIDLTTQSAEGVRRMAFELRPAALEDLGLAAAIRWYSEELAALRKLPVEVHSAGFRGRLPSDVELGVYRVVQEALTNVAKHSGAHKANVLLERLNGNLRVLVEDDGCGFDVSEAASRERGLGLFGMRERVWLLGGTLQIDSHPQHGTRVTMQVPIPDEERET